jgi:hypothetical protein
MTIQGSAESRQIARHVLERETAGAIEESAVGAAMQRAYGQVSESLTRSVGEEGYTALLARALSRSQPEHPLLKHLCQVDGRRIHLDVRAVVGGHGAQAVGEALEALLAAIVDILGGLIGADMVRNLLDHDEPRHPSDNGRPQ